MEANKGITAGAFLMGLGAVAVLILGGLWGYGYVEGGAYSRLAESRYPSQFARAHASAVEHGIEHWSGAYVSAAGTLELGLDNFAFVKSIGGCGLSPNGYNFGSVEELDGKIVLHRFYGDQTRNLREVYIPVLWESQAYLVGEEDLPKFCSLVNGGARYSFGILSKVEFLTRYVAQPTLPLAYQEYLLAIPVHAKTLAVSSGVSAESDSVRITLNVGTDEGVCEGMVLARCGSQSDGLIIESVSAHESIAVCDGIYGAPRPTLDWCFTTGGEDSECR